MSKSITLEIPESEAANFESMVDRLPGALRHLDEEHDQRWEQIERLKAETHLMLEQIKAGLNVEKTI